MTVNGYADNVFVNCPFDEEYKEIFDALIFTIFDCGFVPRCALEADDSGDIRIEKLFSLIVQSKYGFHDISRTELCTPNKLPRFNMPLELSMFLGVKKSGDAAQKRKNCVIFDSKPYRYQKFISDIAGQDIRNHHKKPMETVIGIRNWLSTSSRRKSIPGGTEIWKRYKKLKKICLSSV